MGDMRVWLQSPCQRREMAFRRCATRCKAISRAGAVPGRTGNFSQSGPKGANPSPKMQNPASQKMTPRPLAAA